MSASCGCCSASAFFSAVMIVPSGLITASRPALIAAFTRLVRDGLRAGFGFGELTIVPANAPVQLGDDGAAHVNDAISVHDTNALNDAVDLDG